MSRDDSVYLRHILDSIKRIEQYSSGAGWEEFSQNFLLQDGIMRQIGIIGEAAKQLSAQFRSKNSHVPWVGIVGMRDKLIHDYLGVDIKAVWKTVQEDIPTLKVQIQELLQ